MQDKSTGWLPGFETYISNHLHAIADLNRAFDEVRPRREVDDGAHGGRSITCPAALVLLGNSLVDGVCVVLQAVSYLVLAARNGSRFSRGEHTVVPSPFAP